MISTTDVISSVSGNKVVFDFVVVFENEIPQSDIFFRLWDANRNSMELHLPNVLTVKIFEQSDVIITIEPEDEFEEINELVMDSESIFSWQVFNEWAGYSSDVISDKEFLSHLDIECEWIPNWVKENNTKWLKDDLLTQEDLLDSIKYLMKKE